MKKITLYTEICYIGGLLFLALGACLMVMGNFGVSVVVAPAYLLHVKLSETWSFITFGVAEYLVQGALLLLMCICVRRFHWTYLLSFATTLLYGQILDGFLLLLSPLSTAAFPPRILFFVLGMLLCALGVSLMLHTYLPPEVYELLLKEFTGCFGFNPTTLKRIYDAGSCTLAVGMSFAFFGLFQFVGVNIGTVVCTLLNGSLIGFCSRFLERHFQLRPQFRSFSSKISPPMFPLVTNATAPDKKPT